MVARFLQTRVFALVVILMRELFRINNRQGRTTRATTRDNAVDLRNIHWKIQNKFKRKAAKSAENRKEEKYIFLKYSIPLRAFAFSAYFALKQKPDKGKFNE